MILYYNRLNKLSFNALLGALESRPFFDRLAIHCPAREEQLVSCVQRCAASGPRTVVAFSLFTSQLWDTCRLLQTLQPARSPACIFIAGGPHPTGDPHGTLKLGFDIVIRGEGEETFAELLDRILAQKDYSDVRGLAHIDRAGAFCYTGPRAPISLDDYQSFPTRMGRASAIEITRGCSFVCSFCQTPRIFGTRIRHRSIASICSHVDFIKRKDLPDIRFISPNALSYGASTGKEPNLVALQALLSRVKQMLYPDGRLFFGTFPSEVRPEHITPDTLALLRQYTDNDNITIGGQSGSQRMLEQCRRGHTCDDIYRAVELTVGAGLKASVDFIFGLPEETEADVRATLHVLDDLSAMGARIHAHTFMPLPQTPLGRKAGGSLCQDARSRLERLISKGSAFGAWRQQELLAGRMAQYLQTGSL